VSAGKFEGCADEALAQELNRMSGEGFLDKELGSVEDFGWFGLMLELEPAKKSYIVWEDGCGFFDYREYETKEEAEGDWELLEEQYSEYLGEAEL
jgi:hypothetical protein